jgi:hypothetical protein
LRNNGAVQKPITGTLKNPKAKQKNDTYEIQDDDYDGGGGSGGGVACFQHVKRTSGEDKTDDTRILEIMHGSGRRQCEGKEYVTASSASLSGKRPSYHAGKGTVCKITHKENLPT